MPAFFRKVANFILDIFETLVIALSIFLIVYLFLLQPHQVNGQSMEPTFQDGDYVLTDKISYKLGDPERGDIVVFRAPPGANCPVGTGCDFIKRVIALPGEMVEIKEDQFFVNSLPLDEDYLSEGVKTKSGQYTNDGAVTLSANEYFVVGDNRPYSSDSRVWGPVDKSMIVGKAFFRYWPSESVGVIQSAKY